MNLSGEFMTSSSPAQLVGMSTEPARLAGVRLLSGVSGDARGRIRATFTPSTQLGRIPMTTTITTDRAAESGVRVRVNGRRGQHSVDVTLSITFDPVGPATRVAWTAEVRLGGVGASVGQRVAQDIARTAIDDVLRQVADHT